MATRKPIVNTAIAGSGVPWVSRDGESGLTVAPCDSAALAAALRRLLSDRELAQRLGEGGRARIEREFTKAAMASQTLALYRSLVPSSRPREPRQSDCAPIDSYKNP
jgi:rhamnosyl/mannosyltransferase